MPWDASSSQSSQPSDASSDPSSSSELKFSMIEIDGHLYYLSSMYVDQCILNFSHTMNVDLLYTFVKYATGLSDQKITTIVFKIADEQLQNQSKNKKVVGFWHPQLSKFVLNTQMDANVEQSQMREGHQESIPCIIISSFFVTLVADFNSSRTARVYITFVGVNTTNQNCKYDCK